MPWLKRGDQYTEHAAIDGLSDGAYRLHDYAQCYAQRNLTDGRIPDDRPPRLIRGFKPRYVDELVAAGLWEPADGGGFWIIPMPGVTWEEWMKTREWWDNRRADTAKRVKKWREKRGD